MAKGRKSKTKRPQSVSRRQRLAKKKSKKRTSTSKQYSVKSKKSGKKKQQPLDYFENAGKPIGWAQKFAKKEKQKLF